MMRWSSHGDRTPRPRSKERLVRRRCPCWCTTRSSGRRPEESDGCASREDVGRASRSSPVRGPIRCRPREPSRSDPLAICLAAITHCRPRRECGSIRAASASRSRRRGGRPRPARRALRSDQPKSPPPTLRRCRGWRQQQPGSRGALPGTPDSRHGDRRRADPALRSSGPGLFTGRGASLCVESHG